MIATKSEHLTATNGARVEVGTVVAPNGTEHAAHGSIVDHERGEIFAYVRGVESPNGGNNVGRTWELTTWDGATLGTVVVVSSWPNPRGVWSSRVYAFRATVDGRTYFGRGGGPGLCLRLRAVKVRAK